MGFDLFDKIGDAISSVADIGSDIIDAAGDVVDNVVDFAGDVAKVALPIVASFIPGVPGQVAAAGAAGVFGAGGTTDIEISITQPITQTTFDTEELLASLEELIGSIVAAAVGDVAEVGDGLIDQISELLTSSLGEVIQLDTLLTETAVEGIGDVVGQGLDTVTTAQDASLSSIDELTRQALLELDVFSAGIFSTAKGHLDNVAGETLELSQVVTEQTEASIDAISTVWELIAAGQLAYLEELITGADSLGTLITDQLENVASALRVFQQAQEVLFRQLFGIGDDEAPPDVWRGLGSIYDSRIGALNADLSEAFNLVTPAEGAVCLTVDQWSAMLERVAPQSGVGRAIWAVLLALPTVWTGLSTFQQIQAASMSQAWAMDCPFQLLSPPDVVNALHRGHIDHDTAVITLRRQGLSDSDAETLLKGASVIPNELDLAGMMLRDIISEPAFDGAMQAKGWERFWIDRLKEFVFFIPPVADLVVMAVREVFSPEIAEAQGQFEDFPEDFATYAKQQGVSEEWAKRYWAAHWGLPSVQMGYEMLHRKVIDEAKLKQLLRSQDVMPAWRDPLIAISYSPYTRVDIRRMHALELLTREEVKLAYEELGYDEAKAENLTKFTEELNKEDEADEVEELKEATRASVISFYKDGIIDEAAAVLMLADIGYSPVAITLYLTQADLEVEQAERKAERDLVIAQVKAGTLDLPQAQDRLVSLGFTSTEVQRTIADLTRQTQDKPKLPSLALLGKLLDAGQIDAETYLATIKLHGYSDLWAEKIASLSTGDLADAENATGTPGEPSPG